MLLDNFFISFFIAIIGFLIATISSTLGIGGGVFTVPLLFFTGESILNSAHIGLMSITGSLLMAFIFSLSASIKNYKKKNIVYDVALLIILGALLGSILATYITTNIDTQQIMLLFSFFLFFNGIFGIYKLYRFTKNNSIKENTQHSNNSQASQKKVIIIFSGACVGMVSSLTGIGGGIIIVPLLLNVIHLPPHKAVATSSFCIVFIALSGCLAYFFQSQTINVDLPEPNIGFLYIPILIPLVIGGIIGGYIGAFLTHKISTFYLKLTLSLLQIVIALKIILF